MSGTIRARRALLPLALAASLAVLPAATGSGAGAGPPRCTRAAVKAALGSQVRSVNALACQGGFAAGSATTRGPGGYDYNYVVRARGSRWVKAGCRAKGLPPRLRAIACTSS